MMTRWAASSSRRRLRPGQPALQPGRIDIGDGDDAEAGPDLTRAGRGLVPLLLDAELDRVRLRQHPAGAGKADADLVQRLAARCLAH